MANGNINNGAVQKLLNVFGGKSQAAGASSNSAMAEHQPALSPRDLSSDEHAALLENTKNA